MPTAHYTSVPAEPHRDRRRTGQPVPDGWQTVYLTRLRKHGTAWRAAKQAGVSYSTVQRLRGVDGRFATDEHDAVQEHADSLEGILTDIAKDKKGMPSVVAATIKLKKLRPEDFIERNQTLTVTVSTTVDGASGRELLQTMLRHVTPATTQSLSGQEVVTGQHASLKVLPPPEA